MSDPVTDRQLALLLEELTWCDALIFVVRTILVAAVPNDRELRLDHAWLNLCDANVCVHKFTQQNARDGVYGAFSGAVDGACVELQTPSDTALPPM